ncbi:hypothetical protein JKP88DRAFT_339673 [Tribonema minus]|uniref:Uncharacterized protein n=1 Tax=Tribonema minus TaxID=303371 RepID=A0A836C824_9STRA|nr:hypothetical protein JKP88DRAFT_339673 [Tribonema minus]
MSNRRLADDGKRSILVRLCRSDDSKCGCRTRMRRCHDRVFISAAATDCRESIVCVALSSKDKYGEKYSDTVFANGWHDLPDGGQAVMDRMLGAIVYQRTFHVSFTGISNTAGHDNMKEQAYPWHFETILAPVFARAGVDFTASNGAIGNNDILPYSYCMEAHAGAHPDIVSWEMGMQIEGVECFPKSEYLEYWIRNVIALPSQPIPVVLEAVSKRRWCPGNRELSYSNYDFNQMFGRCWGDRPTDEQRRKDQMDYYKDFGIHALHLDDLLSHTTCGDDLFDEEHLYGNKDAEYVTSLAATLNLPAEPARRHPVPMPNFCISEQCVKAGSYNCLTSYYPNLEDSLQLKAHITQSAFNATERTQYLPDVPEEWQIVVNERATDIGEFHFNNASWPVDRKWVLAGDKRAGALNIAFTTQGVHENALGHAGATEPIMLCRQLSPQHTHEEDAAQSLGSVATMWFMVDGQPSPPCTAAACLIFELLPRVSSRLRRTQPSGASRGPPDRGIHSVCWTLDVRVGNGDHLLTIVPLKEGPENLVRISHVIVPK